MVESHMDMEVILNMEKVAYSLPHIPTLVISGHHLVHPHTMMMMIMITMIQSAIG